MTAIPHAAEALTSASGRFERASARLLEAASGVGGNEESAAAAIAEMSTARVQHKAAAAMIRFSDELWTALMDISAEPKQPA